MLGVNKKNIKIITVHGTFDGDQGQEKAADQWWRSGSDFLEEFIDGLGVSKRPHIEEFIWSSENSDVDRNGASKALISTLKKALSKAEQVIVIAHSHGGNIVAQSLAHGRLNLNRISAISVGTPFLKRQRSFLGWVVLLSEFFVPVIAFPMLYAAYVEYQDRNDVQRIESVGDVFTQLGRSLDPGVETFFAGVFGFIFALLFWVVKYKVPSNRFAPRSLFKKSGRKPNSDQRVFARVHHPADEVDVLFHKFEELSLNPMTFNRAFRIVSRLVLPIVLLAAVGASVYFSTPGLSIPNSIIEADRTEVRADQLRNASVFEREIPIDSLQPIVDAVDRWADAVVAKDREFRDDLFKAMQERGGVEDRPWLRSLISAQDALTESGGLLNLARLEASYRAWPGFVTRPYADFDYVSRRNNRDIPYQPSVLINALETLGDTVLENPRNLYCRSFPSDRSEIVGTLPQILFIPEQEITAEYLLSECADLLAETARSRSVLVEGFRDTLILEWTKKSGYGRFKTELKYWNYRDGNILFSDDQYRYFLDELPNYHSSLKEIHGTLLPTTMNVPLSLNDALNHPSRFQDGLILAQNVVKSRTLETNMSVQKSTGTNRANVLEWAQDWSGYVIVGMLAFALFARGLVGLVGALPLTFLVNSNFQNILTSSLFGRDGDHAVVPMTETQRLTKFGPVAEFTNDMEEKIAEVANSAVTEAVEGVRANIVSFERADNLDEFLTWKELIHTAYFRTPGFGRFLATLVD